MTIENSLVSRIAEAAAQFDGLSREEKENLNYQVASLAGYAQAEQDQNKTRNGQPRSAS